MKNALKFLIDCSPTPFTRKRPALFRAWKNTFSVCACAVALSGCWSVTGDRPGAGLPANPQQQAQTEQPAQPSPSDTIGNGPVKVGLVVPLTQNGGRPILGGAFRNAVELAVTDMGQNDITVLVKDDQSTPDGARIATQAALAEGAELVLGPLSLTNVPEAGRVAKAAGRPVIAFSTDTSVASRGVYLLSFPVELSVDRVIEFAAQKGKKSIAALLPDTVYGNAAAAEFQSAAARAGMRVMTMERYNAGSLTAAAQHINQLGDQIDSLFIAEQPEAMPAVAKALTANAVDSKKVQILGTNLWSDPRVLKLPAVQGAWFAGPENGGYNNFAQKYKAKFGVEPQRLATVAYDATTLAILLARSQGSQRYAESVLTDPSGFSGADGTFRFKVNGLIERCMAVMQISNGTSQVISPTPKSFTSPPSGT